MLVVVNILANNITFVCGARSVQVSAVIVVQGDNNRLRGLLKLRSGAGALKKYKVDPVSSSC